jgi:cyclic dehypoxanthinyl futalosine synthase
MIEENVVAQAGTVYYLSLETIRRSIEEAGYMPRQRNVFYEYIDDYDSTASAADRPTAPTGLVSLN